MGEFDPAFVHSLAVQSWSLYGVGMFLILLRTSSRIHRLGIGGLQVDDYLMIWAGGLYTTLMVCLNVISGGGGSNLYPPGAFETFTAENIQERIKGSKIGIVSEQAMLNVIYTIKACMLIMFTRLTLGLQVQRMVLYLAVYVVIGWVATEIAFFTACTPFSGYWAMPPTPQCATLEHYAIVQACFNISSDVLMLFIPLPLLTKLSIPLKQKLVLLVIFSMGLFVILAAILTKVFNLSNFWEPTYMLWYTREASVAVYVSNLPMIWPLLREWFPVLKQLTPGQKSSLRGTGGVYASRKGGFRMTTKGRGLSVNRFGGKRLSDGGIITTILAKGESTEELSTGSEDTELGILRFKDGYETNPSMRGDDESWHREQQPRDKGGITLTRTVHISEENIYASETRIQNLGPAVIARNRDKDDFPHTSYDWDYGRSNAKR
ncbi:uncharacterized protein RSE6_05303 [Rhynchosporium secalis]|uniref:Rhodopsin domain-containing protein n=1 Tax=Rhynchosporium secalis TaxID=38038 RepID=A0A1E1M7F1_RHYSE|nr:uncharacterized protein RSE6_05303 [Rhynchosporium secalis]